MKQINKATAAKAEVVKLKIYSSFDGILGSWKKRTEILEHTGGDETKTIVWPNVNKMYCSRILSLF